MSALDELMSNIHWMIHDLVDGDQIDNEEEERLEELREKSAAELSALRERVEAYHEQIAEVNELLWEFTENPNIEMGETGHEKIEDYFKKYSSNAESPAP